MAEQERIERERQFWDDHSPENLYADWVEQSYDEWRSPPVVKRATDFLGPVNRKRILICSEGKEVIPFARQGAEVWCFDISAVRVAALQRLVDRCGLTERVHLAIMPFETLDYPDGFFDLAFGWAVVHHVDLARAGAELARVLRPGGRGSFIEPLGVNPILQLARTHIPYRHKGRSEDEAPFTYDEIRSFGAAFGHLEWREYALLGALRWRVVKSAAVGDWLDRADSALLRAPSLRPLCSQVWIGVETIAAGVLRSGDQTVRETPVAAGAAR